MQLSKLFVGDFETDGIEARPAYPPRPVGLAIRTPERTRYYAWGHPSENNASRGDAVDHLRMLYRAGYAGVWHNAGFDLDVAETHLGVAWPAEHHDTLILAYLEDPRSPTFSLKPLAERYLGMAPDERDELRDWILANVPEARRAKKQWGRYISRAPGGLVGRYAIGDVDRTWRLFQRFRREVLGDPEQRRAYERERRLTRVIIAMERRGVPVATRRLKADVPPTERRLRRMELRLMDRLRVPKKKRADFSWSGEGFADQLERCGAVREWILTENGARRTGADSLTEVGCDPRLVKALEVRSQIQTCLSTFMKPWLAQGLENGGRFYARFNQVRQDYHGGDRMIGTETGRLSMTPNLQNVIRSDKDPRVPRLRDYIVPPAGQWLIQRDYSQQELRILAHFEDGPFLAKYLADPTIDAHVAVGELINELVGVLLPRRTTKDINFGTIYGMGVAKLALKLGVPTAEARKLLRAHAAALPGLKVLKAQLDECSREGRPIYTWGGRRYFCEPPRYVKKHDRVMTFEYRLLNIKIQGSAADCTKQAMLNYSESGADDKWPLLLQVHDELLAACPPSRVAAAHRALRDAMADVEFKVPMLSDGKAGGFSWHRMEKCG